MRIPGLHLAVSSEHDRVFPVPQRRNPRPLGQLLLSSGKISARDLTQALAMQRKIDAPLGDILLAEGLICAADLSDALSAQHHLDFVDLHAEPPTQAALAALPPEFCLHHRILPLRKTERGLIVATARPDKFAAVASAHPIDLPPLLPALAEDEMIRACQSRCYGDLLAEQAEARVPAEWSCRNWSGSATRRGATALGIMATLAACLALWPQLTYGVLLWLAMITLALSVGFKTSAAIAQIRADRRARHQPPRVDPTPLRLPVVSVMVPLLHEREIAGALIERLSRLTYPKALLDVVLVLEAEDKITHETLARTRLPHWMRVIEVPKGSGLTTKPRALNFALDFCRGSLVGIWDAEDAPEPDQVQKIVTRFHAAAPDVVCLQGRLDYYNPRANWLSRCFTIEYAAWWRVILPGVSQLGLVIPLGGTTLFFRRDKLEELGGWDAHNVTEDADLGIRLARAGYRTELIDTVTHEEANCRMWPWIRQRSRWLKGFAITWAVHAREPRQLLRELGLYRFIGLHVFFITALSQFLLAPVFWSLMLVSAGVLTLPPLGIPLWAVAGFFIACEAITLGLHAFSVRSKGHRHLIPWTLTMVLYFPMACVAIYKALYELIGQPFYWDKTQHGVTEAEDGPAQISS